MIESYLIARQSGMTSILVWIVFWISQFVENHKLLSTRDEHFFLVGNEWFSWIFFLFRSLQGVQLSDQCSAGETCSKCERCLPTKCWKPIMIEIRNKKYWLKYLLVRWPTLAFEFMRVLVFFFSLMKNNKKKFK